MISLFGGKIVHKLPWIAYNSHPISIDCWLWDVNHRYTDNLFCWCLKCCFLVFQLRSTFSFSPWLVYLEYDMQFPQCRKTGNGPHWSCDWWCPWLASRSRQSGPGGGSPSATQSKTESNEWARNVAVYQASNRTWRPSTMEPALKILVWSALCAWQRYGGPPCHLWCDFVKNARQST